MEKIEKKLIKSTKSYKLIITDNLEKKIRLLCNKFPSLEWSGMLFFNYTGNFKEDNLVCTATDLYLMDIGNATHTDFNMSAEVINYMTTNNLLDSQIGLIHSHNTMETFFSGEDQNTLITEGTDRNNFLSLIVNNAGDYTAAITRNIKVKIKSNSELSYEFFDKGINQFKQDSVADKIIIEYFNLEIKKSDLFSNKDLEDRIGELQQAAKTINKHNFSNYPYLTGGDNPYDLYGIGYPDQLTIPFPDYDSINTDENKSIYDENIEKSLRDNAEYRLQQCFSDPNKEILTPLKAVFTKANIAILDDFYTEDEFIKTNFYYILTSEIDYNIEEALKLYNCILEILNNLPLNKYTKICSEVVVYIIDDITNKKFLI